MTVLRLGGVKKVWLIDNECRTEPDECKQSSVEDVKRLW